MKGQVYLSPKASQQLTQIIEYLSANWGNLAISDFIKKLDRSERVLSLYPESFPRSIILPGLHRCNLSKQQAIYYRISAEKDAEIIALFDTRQDPEKLVLLRDSA